MRHANHDRKRVPGFGNIPLAFASLQLEGALVSVSSQSSLTEAKRGAGRGNRTLASSLGSWQATITSHPRLLKRVLANYNS